ncbi:PHP domain-containing protein [uncultured Clostridium sp.]|uniref:PHP domain-containing protein n=1 Tax=uncultured Clostridium sp. TaxID=59620 RepID=UPI002605AEA4|nr:PHP domain-containing protein [uncultured Clostridium sp.]
MKYADLHIHSSYSDGKLTPEEIIKISIDKGIRYIAITDHDSIDSQYIIDKEHKNIEIISGIEVSAEINNTEIHMLGYFINPNDEILIKTIDRLKEERRERARKICEKLKAVGVIIDVEKLIAENPTIGRAHIANEIVNCGYEENFKVAFNKYLIAGKQAYEKGKKLTYKEAIKLIRNSGGIPIIAHPGKIYRSMGIENVIKELRCYGLMGVEVYHPSHSKEQINILYNLCKKYKLVITGGSDFHEITEEGAIIGTQGINELLLNKLLNIK